MAKGPEGGSLQVVTSRDLLQIPLTRRQVLIGGALGLAGLAGCSSGEGYDLTPRLGTIYDKGLEEHPEKGLQGVAFSYDSKYADGSIKVVFQLAPPDPQEFRVVSKEVSPRPGYLVDQAYPNTGIDKDGTTFEKYPVIALVPGDEEVVYIGTGSGPETYRDMRTYQIFSKVTNDVIVGLEGRFSGLTTLQPPLPLRDS